MKLTPAHTPGPWYAVKRNEQTAVNGRRITVDAAGSVIADVDWNKPAENLANAQLIAAAPDLLEALKDMLSDYRQCGMDKRQVCEVARAAIAKTQSP